MNASVIAHACSEVLQPIRETRLPRARLQQIARALGLPATGTSGRIARYVQIATSDPRAWSRGDFDMILPHLSIHQDVHGNGNVKSILREGLLRGMVDPAMGLEPDGRQWTWARGYLGTDVYVFVTEKLKYLGKGNPRLAAGNIPVFHVKPAKHGSLWTAISEGAVTRTA